MPARGQPDVVNPLRRTVVMVAIAAAAVGLVARAVDLNLNRKDFLQSQGDARSVRTVAIPAHRGTMVDRNGEPLAISTPVESIWVVPGEVAKNATGVAALSGVLGLDRERLQASLDARRDREFMYVRRHVEPALAEAVAALQIPGVHEQREYRRYYPLGEAAAHVVGVTDVDDEGQEGLELAFGDDLRGTPGAKRVLKDRLGRAVEDVDSLSVPHHGQRLILSIDGRIQSLAYQALLAAVKKHRARAGSAVVLDALSGEVLAMVNQPSYNPNNRGDRAGARVRNRAVTDVFEPGSTFKPFTVAAALETGRYRPDTRVDTGPGFLSVGRHTIKDARNYGDIDVTRVIKKSSNVGAARIAMDLDPKVLWQTFSRVGFGNTTASGYPGETEGTLVHFFDWREIDRVTISFGYGVATSALQLAQAYAVIANGGLLPRVTFLHKPHRGHWARVMSERTAHEVRTMLETVVAGDGTGRRAHVNGYRVGGKTGTVRKSIAGGYSEDRYHALFAGIAPLSAPRIVTVVHIDEPAGEQYYGGQVAAPVFAQITAGALRILGVAPDDDLVVTRRIRLDAEAPATVGAFAAAAATITGASREVLQ